MIPFRTRKDVIDWAEENLPSAHRSIARAFRQGSVEFLGGFRHIVGSKPGWIIKLKSKFKKIYYIAIVCNGLDYGIHILNKVSWQYWDGDRLNNSFFQGDNPSKYRRLKNDYQKDSINN